MAHRWPCLIQMFVLALPLLVVDAKRVVRTHDALDFQANRSISDFHNRQAYFHANSSKGAAPHHIITKEDADIAAAQHGGRKPAEENTVEDFFYAMKGLVYSSVEGGDMVIRPTDHYQEVKDPVTGESLLQIGVNGRGFDTWPDGKVYYRFKESQITCQIPGCLDEFKQAFREACDEWSRKVPCLRFFDKTGQSWPSDKPIITVTASGSLGGGGCWSYVGYGHPDELNLEYPGCWGHGIILHEIGHALGRTHEHSRWDRDTKVDINWDLIKPGTEHNFRKEYKAYTMDEYDYGSIMHYDAASFSTDPWGAHRRPTIVAKERMAPGTTMGNREGLTKQDANKLRDMYGCRDVMDLHVRPIVERSTTTTKPPCTPYDCFSHRISDCGEWDDGCGGKKRCGNSSEWFFRPELEGCPMPESRNHRSVCSEGRCHEICVKQTRCPAHQQCGIAPDGCHGTLSCGRCPRGTQCKRNACVKEETYAEPKREQPDARFMLGQSVGVQFISDVGGVATVMRTYFDTDAWQWSYTLTYGREWRNMDLDTVVFEESLYLAAPITTTPAPPAPPAPPPPPPVQPQVQDDGCTWKLKSEEHWCKPSSKEDRITLATLNASMSMQSRSECERLASAPGSGCGRHFYLSDNGRCACVREGRWCHSRRVARSFLYYKDCGEQCPEFAKSPMPDSDGNCECATLRKKNRRTGQVSQVPTVCYHPEKFSRGDNIHRGQCPIFRSMWTELSTSGQKFHVLADDAKCCLPKSPTMHAHQCESRRLMLQ